MSTFVELGVPQKLADVLSQHAITTPFAIQALTLADAMAGRDICGRAPTGSGKTLAFSVPLVVRAGRGKPRRPGALVLTPTRELAAQVSVALLPLAKAMGRRVATFYGGTSISRDRQRLRAGVDVAVACPGRLSDLVRRGDVDLRNVDFVVVDEADRMADMGFLPEVKALLDATSPQRQTLLFSATLDGDVDVLIRRYQRDPARHEIEAADDAQGEVRHVFWHTAANDRVKVAGDIIRAVAPAIVFTRTKHGADRVARQLDRDGVTSAAIHGGRTQSQRDRALRDFTSGRVTTLVATDVAARGIHVDNVGVVVHFDPPANEKDYVHRSGRTGRAGADGVVVTLVPPDRLGDVRTMQRALDMGGAVETVALESLTAEGWTPAPAAPESRAPGRQRRPGTPGPARRPHRRPSSGRSKGRSTSR